MPGHQVQTSASRQLGSASTRRGDHAGGGQCLLRRHAGRAAKWWSWRWTRQRLSSTAVDRRWKPPAWDPPPRRLGAAGRAPLFPPPSRPAGPVRGGKHPPRPPRLVTEKQFTALEGKTPAQNGHEALDLLPHPEGGWFRQTWAAGGPRQMHPPRATAATARPPRRSISCCRPGRAPTGTRESARQELWLYHSGSPPGRCTHWAAPRPRVLGNQLRPVPRPRLRSRYPRRKAAELREQYATAISAGRSRSATASSPRPFPRRPEHGRLRRPGQRAGPADQLGAAPRRAVRAPGQRRHRRHPERAAGGNECVERVAGCLDSNRRPRLRRPHRRAAAGVQDRDQQAAQPRRPQETFGGRGASWKGAFIGGDLLVQAVTEGPPATALRELPDLTSYPKEKP